MQFARQVDYRGYTLIFFQSRGNGKSHWLVIAPDGINIVGPPCATEDEALAAVDAMLDPPLTR